MPSAAALRIQIEHALERRFPAALTPVPRTMRETASTRIPEVDCLLDGGLPVGAISEITGPVSSGRTSLAHAFLAARTQEECVCAWVDAHDAFDSESAAASGVALRQLLWVRCKSRVPDQQAAFPNSAVKSGVASARPWTHPVYSHLDYSHLDYSHLDQALRATDLLLQAGGFAAIVLDLGSTAPEQGARIPLATWFRFRQAADRTRCSLLVLAQEPLAQASAALVLRCAALRESAPLRDRAPRAATPGQKTVLAGFDYQVSTGRVAAHPSTPFIAGKRKPPASIWTASAPWQRESSL